MNINLRIDMLYNVESKLSRTHLGNAFGKYPKIARFIVRVLKIVIYGIFVEIVGSIK